MPKRELVIASNTQGRSGLSRRDVLAMLPQDVDRCGS